MEELHDESAVADERVKQARESLAIQQEVVARLEAQGAEARVARMLLKTYEEALAACISERDQLRHPSIKEILSSIE
jgi:hypothetical protein